MGQAPSLASLRCFSCPPLIRNNPSSLSTPSLPYLLHDCTGCPGRDGTEQEETRPTQAAEATGSMRAATATREGPVRMLLFVVIVSLLSSFLHFTLLLFSIISFPTSTTTGVARKESAGRTGRDIRGRG